MRKIIAGQKGFIASQDCSKTRIRYFAESSSPGRDDHIGTFPNQDSSIANIPFIRIIS
jgi:hypothetical protein